MSENYINPSLSPESRRNIQKRIDAFGFEQVIAGGINRSLLEGAANIFSRFDVDVTDFGVSYEQIRELMKRWESEGIIEILSDPEKVAIMSPVLKMKTTFDKKPITWSCSNHWMKKCEPDGTGQPM